MQIRIRSTGQVVYEGEFRALYPNTSMPQQLTAELLDGYGADVVFEGAQAQPTRYQVAFADGVEQIGVKWFTKYSVRDMDQAAKDALDAQQAGNVRSQRDAKLSETDWRFRSDMTPSQEWIDYCQALRDVPSQEGFPWEVTWPTKPSAE